MRAHSTRRGAIPGHQENQANPQPQVIGARGPDDRLSFRYLEVPRCIHPNPLEFTPTNALNVGPRAELRRRLEAYLRNTAPEAHSLDAIKKNVTGNNEDKAAILTGAWNDPRSGIARVKLEGERYYKYHWVEPARPADDGKPAL